MTRDLAAEWRDLLASGRARWVRGMVTRRGAVALGKPTRNHLPAAPYHERIATARPDFDHPATLGCLLGLVREAWVDAEAHLALGAAGWVLLSGESRVADVVYPVPPGPTEAAALLSALAAAPVRT